MGVGKRVKPPKVNETIAEYTKKEPFLVKTALISAIFNEPITQLENSLSIDQIDKFYNLALWIIDNVYFAPFKK